MLTNIKSYGEYLEYCFINEGLKDGTQQTCNQIFARGPVIKFEDGQSVEPKEIVKVVTDAINYLAEDFQTTFRFAQKINIIFLRNSGEIRTMAVDENMNMYINASFVYHTLQMNKELVAVVIMHEVMHVLFNHIERGKNWLAAKGKPLNKMTNHDNNLAADIEVNQTLVRLRLTTANVIKNVIHGLYLTGTSEELGVNTNVIPMETLLNNEKYMNKLRSMSPPDFDPDDEETNSKITTSKEWDDGYKDAWNKIADLIEKYGYEKVWVMLQEQGVINANGEINPSISPNDVNSMNFIRVKSMDDFINESKNDPQEFSKINGYEKGQVYEDGYASALSKIISQMKAAIDGHSGGNGGESGGRKDKKYETNVKKEDLKKISLSSPDSEGGEGVNNGMPDNFDIKDKKSDKNEEGGKRGDGKSEDGVTDDDPNNLENDPKNKLEDKDNGKDGKSDENEGSSGKQKKTTSAGKGGDGKSEDEISDGDLNKLGKDNSKTIGDSSAIGGMGSYRDSKSLRDDILKEAGYSDEDIAEINRIREKNKVRNSKEGIEKARIELKKTLRGSSVIKRYLDSIEVESAKYRNIWKEIMEEFLAEKTRRAGKDIKGGRNDWKRKERIANGEYGIHREKVAQDPQDVNVYVDVSSSVDIPLLEVISKSMVIFTQQYEYSAINICPWASRSNGIHRIEDYADRTEEDVTEEILKIVSKGISQCGGGTEAKAVLSAMVDVVVENVNDENKDEKDDVHVVITDGYFDYQNVENKLKAVIHSVLPDRDDVMDKCPENTFWMIYDAPEEHMDKWKDEIKMGRLIFINSEVVKNNK